MPRPRKAPTTLKPDVPTLPVRLPRTRKQFEAEQSTAIAPTRPRWEYRTAVSEDGRSYYMRDQGYYEGKPAVSIHFNNLGTEGWELVTIYPVGDAMRAPVYYAVFKREVRE